MPKQEFHDEMREEALDRAKALAKTIYDMWDDWSVEWAVQGAIDDTADDRDVHCDYSGPRHVVYNFLKRNEDEIAWELYEKPNIE